MSKFSTRQTARKLGIDPMTLSRYIRSGKVPAPKMLEVGSASLHAWTDADVELSANSCPKSKTAEKRGIKKSSQQRQNQKRRNNHSRGRLCHTINPRKTGSARCI